MTAKPDLSVTYAGIDFKNPITTASGTFGSGMEYADFTDLSRLGAVTTKGVADKPWEGNGTPRIAETPSGMLNAIGLQNPGVDVFVERDLPFLLKQDTRIIVNVCGHSKAEYLKVIRGLNDTDVDMYEINISCPNVRRGGMAFGTDTKQVEKITSAIKAEAKKPVVMKLSPNVTDITEIARAAESGGADGVSLINTLTGMKIDIERRTYLLDNKTGGLSGPAIHPIAVRMVHDVSRAVSIPVTGMGGVASASDAIEMILAGATMVAVGTANFYNPNTASDIIDGIEDYMDRHGIKAIKELIGAVR